MKKINKLNQEHLNELVTIQYNNHLLNKKQDSSQDAINLDGINPFPNWVAKAHIVVTDEDFTELEREALAAEALDKSIWSIIP